MIEYLAGQMVVKKPTHVVVEVGGVAFHVEIPLSTFEQLPASGRVKVFTYLKVSEDAMKLYGFATENERNVFLHLTDSVARLGPSKSLSILSNVSISRLVRCIEEGDVDTLRRIRGIGEKLAQRLVVELKGKLPRDAMDRTPGRIDMGSGSQEVLQALQSLGYQRPECEEALKKVSKTAGKDAKVEEIIRACLGVL